VGVHLDPAYRAIAIKAVRLMALEVGGVDMVETRSGPKILEINASPGLEGIERASGVDVAGAVIDYAERFVTRRRGQGRRQAVSRLSAVVDDERVRIRKRGVS